MLLGLNLDRPVRCEKCGRVTLRRRWTLEGYHDRVRLDMATMRELTFRNARVKCPECHHLQTKGKWVRWAIERGRKLMMEGATADG